MELKQVRCTTCGFPMTLNLEAKQHRCEACGNTFITKNAEKLNDNRSADYDVLKNSRINLRRSIESNDLNAILHFTNQILTMIPQDFSGLYYNAYAASKLTNPKALHDFLKTEHLEATDEEMTDVIHHIATYTDLRERKLVLSFVETSMPSLISTVKQTFEQRIQKENDYAVVQRDVFICHRSTDHEVAMRILKTLESDGYTCWISSRNLRPDDNENYWKNIAQAIEHCDVFLVVSSQDAMLSKDVQTECQLAAKQKMKRLEYKIDSAIHTTLFKHFFSGVKWINAIQKDAFEELKVRLYDLQHAQKIKTKKAVEKPEVIAQTDIQGLIKRAYFEASLGKKKQAEDILEKVFDSDIENVDAWIIKWLLAAETPNVDDFMLKMKDAPPSIFETLMQEEAYKALNRFAPEHEVLKIFHRDYKVSKDRQDYKVKQEKLTAFNEGDKQRLIALIKEYPQHVLDDFYRVLLSHKIENFDVFKQLLKQENFATKAQQIFEHPTIEDAIDHELIAPYYESFQETLKRIDKERQAAQEAKYQTIKRLAKMTEEHFDNGAFKDVEKLLKEHQSLLDSHPLWSVWQFRLKYRVNDLETLTEKPLGIETKRTLLNEPLIKTMPEATQNIIKRFLEQCQKDVSDYDRERRRIIRARKRRVIFVTLVFLALVSASFMGIKLHAQREIEVLYELNGGITTNMPNRLTRESLLEDLPIPTKTGHTFLGWYLEPTFDSNIEDSVALLSNTSIKLYARWERNEYTLQFHDTSGNLIEQLVIPYGAAIEQIEAPTKEGHQFTHWQPALPNTMPANHLVLTAQYQINQYELNFVVNGGTTVPSLMVNFNALVPVRNTVKTGYVFEGWFLDPNFNQQVPTRMPAQHLTLYARFTPRSYTISFRDDERVHFQQTFDFNTDLSQHNLPIPTREGFDFLGWYEDEALSNLATLSTMPARNLTLYAKWEPIDFTLTYVLNDGQNHHDNPTQFNALSDMVLKAPSREGFIFEGWFDNPFFQGQPINHLPPGQIGDVTLYAKWAPAELYTIHYFSQTLHIGDSILDYDDVFISVALGGAHSGALTHDGRVFTWGLNAHGRLGDGTTTTRSVPTEITEHFDLDDGERIVSLVLGLDHSGALTSHGRVFTWGSNNHGRLGDGTQTSRHVPMEITSLFSLTPEDKIVSLVFGQHHSAALSAQGRVFVWGRNSQGQLGDGTTTHRLVPTEITAFFSLSETDRLVQLSLGGAHSSALSEEGHLFTWGANTYGQLGDGTMIDRLYPTNIRPQLDLEVNESILEMRLGQQHSGVITSAARLFTWGNNSEGQLGDLTQDHRVLPTEIQSHIPLLQGEMLVALAFGSQHSSVLTSQGRVFVWGRNHHGQLGNDSLLTQTQPVDISSHFNLSDNDDVALIVLGSSHSSALSSQGTLFFWGNNSQGQLGSHEPSNTRLPDAIVSKETTLIKQEDRYEQATLTLYDPVRPGYEFLGWSLEKDLFKPWTETFMPSAPLTLYAHWSRSFFTIHYELFNGDNHTHNPFMSTFNARPMVLLEPEKEGHTFGGWFDNEDFSGTPLVNLSRGQAAHHTLYAKWTINHYDIHYYAQIDVVSSMPLLFNETIIHTVNGSNISGFITSLGRVFMWGSNTHGQLGDGTTVDRDLPVEITEQFNLQPGEAIIDLKIASAHTMAISSFGRVFVWGSNSQGQLGDGTRNHSTTPLDITAQFNLNHTDRIVTISSRGLHTAALSAEGQLYVWGWNVFGQLGDGSTLTRLNPINLTEEFNLNEEEYIKSISLGQHHSSALTSIGRLFIWGHNDVGQLGNGTQINTLTPYMLNDDIGLNMDEVIVAVSLGDASSSLLTSQGRVFTWGSNSGGQLGDGTQGSMRLIPQDITSQFTLSSNETIVSLKMSSAHAGALTSYGRLFLWGWNSHGQLGDGSTTHRRAPQDISQAFTLNEMDDIIAFSLGSAHTTALTHQGQLFGWGSNSHSQLAQDLENAVLRPYDLMSKKFIEIKRVTYAFDDLIETFNPTQEIKAFQGWYTEEQWLNRFIDGRMPSENLHLYSRWEPISD